MVDREVFDRRLGKIETLLRDLRGVAVVRRERFLSDRALQAQAERWLHLTAECLLDLAHHLIADRGWRTPDTYRQAARILREEGVITEEAASIMEGLAGLRNVLVHLYLDVDEERVWEILQNDLDAIEECASALSRASRGSSE